MYLFLLTTPRCAQQIVELADLRPCPVSECGRAAGHRGPRVAGRPVVASAVGPLPELVGPAGLLVEPRDADRLAVALATIWADDDVHDGIADVARERAGDETADLGRRGRRDPAGLRRGRHRAAASGLSGGQLARAGSAWPAAVSTRP